jgi:acyl-CoA reductase-like NAD-dependent aldehyde dehydrogenase
VETHSNYAGGWVSAEDGPTFTTWDPAGSRNPVASFQASTSRDADKAAQVAVKSQEPGLDGPPSSEGGCWQQQRGC